MAVQLGKLWRRTEDRLITLVLEGVTSVHSRRAYRAGSVRFFTWFRLAAPAEIPEYARSLKGERACTVSFVVGTDGRPSSIHVTAASRDKVRKPFEPGPCETEAIDVITEYRNKPATFEGKPVLFQLTIDLKYRN